MDHDDRGWSRRDTEARRRFPPRLSADERERRDAYLDDPRGRERDEYGRSYDAYGRPYETYGREYPERDPRRDVYEPQRETPGDRERWGSREARGWEPDAAWRGDVGRPYRNEFGGDPAPRRDWDPPNFSGLGPSRYRRSDEKIYDELNDRLTDHPAIDATDMEVFVEEGIVTLKGFVRSRQQKRMAEDLAEFATGVREVRNELRVGTAPRDAGAAGEHRVGDATASRLTSDMEVLDVAGERVGAIKQVHGDVFHLDRPMKRDLYVPLRAVREIAEGRAVLQYRMEDLDEMGWESPELMGLGTKRR